MRIREAKRLSAHLFHRGFIPYDYWSEIFPLNPVLTYNPKNRQFRCVIRSGAAKLCRTHACAFVLIRLVAEVVVGSSFAKFQRQPVWFKTMSSPLSRAVTTLIEDYGLETKSVYGYRHFRPQMLGPLPREHPDVTTAIAAEMNDPFSLPDELKDEIKNYVHSSTVKDMGLVAPSMVGLGEKPERPINLDVAWDIFVDNCLALPYTVEGELLQIEIPEFTAVEMCRQAQTTSSAGLMPLSNQDGNVTGTKKEMHDSAIAINLQDKLGQHLPPANVFKSAPKGEVIKINKRVRSINLESQPNYMVLKHYFGPLASEWADFASGVAIGMSSRNGDFKAIPLSWWLETDLTYEEFIDWLDQQQGHESDKAKWEASTNATDGFPFLLDLLLRVRVNEADKALVVRALADYVRPHVLFDLNRVYSVKWRVPSGSYLTSYGNSKRHASMVNWVIGWLAEHRSAGSNNCSCFVCEAGKHLGLEGWGAELQESQLRILSRFHVMGDDFIAINPVPYVFDWVMDFVFGTETKTVIKPFFCTPGLETPEGCEFLRRHFALDRTVTPPRICTFRAAGRVLGKLFNGGHRHSKERFLAAVDSALNDCGYNQPLFRVLFNLHYIISGNGPIDIHRYRDALEEYLRKNPTLGFMALGYVPSFADIVNLDADTVGPLMAVKKSLACRELGLTPRAYESVV